MDRYSFKGIWRINRNLLLGSFLALLLTSGCTTREEKESESPISEQSSASEGSQAPSFSLLQPGDTAPVFEGRGLDGSIISVGPDQPLTLVNLWATWCGPCIEEFPDLQAVHEQLGSDKFRILAVNVDELDTESIGAFVDELGVTFEIALDPAGDYQNRLRAVAMPSSFLIDSNGTLIQSWTGRLAEDQLSELESLIVEHIST